MFGAIESTLEIYPGDLADFMSYGKQSYRVLFVTPMKYMDAHRESTAKEEAKLNVTLDLNTIIQQ